MSPVFRGLKFIESGHAGLIIKGRLLGSYFWYSINTSWIDKQNTLGALQKVGLRVKLFLDQKLRRGAREKQAVRFPIDHFGALKAT